MSKLSIMDLTADQAEEVEEKTGIPLDKWADAPKVKLFRTILMVWEGMPASAYASLSLGELLDRVTFEDSDPEAEAESPVSLGSSAGR